MNGPDPLYTREVLRLAAAAPAHGLLEGVAPVEMRSPTCGSRMRLTVRADEQGQIVEIGQEIEACAFGQASAALMALGAVGRSRGEAEGTVAALDDWLSGRRADPGPWPGLEALAPAVERFGRHGAILMPFRALVRAMGG